MSFFNINPFSLAKRIKRPLILDGAMGSMLQKEVMPDSYLWMSKTILSNPNLVLDTHKKYIDAGADIITTDTFRTNPAAVKKHGSLKSDILVKKAVNIAKKAKNGLPIFIAGSNPPAEDCYQKERTLNYNQLKLNHVNHIKSLIDNGADFILNETQSHFDEIKIICNYCYENKIPYVLSLYLDDKLNLLSGEALKDIIPYIVRHAPLAIAFNCIKPNLFEKIHKKIKLNFNWGVYFNCGIDSVLDENIECGISPKEYSKVIKELLKYQPSFVGACCGSDPNHIKQLKKVIDGNFTN